MFYVFDKCVIKLINSVGCGRKRSDESMATLVDLRSEPAVEEISRQIMSEAKLWEAIQEARLELIRQQRQNKAVSITYKLIIFYTYLAIRSISAVNYYRIILYVF